MEYSILELLFFFFFYSVLGWVSEVVILTVITHRLHNRGILNLPLCPAHGISICILIAFLPTLQGHYILQFISCTIITSTIAHFSGGIGRHVTGIVLWDYMQRSLFANHHFRTLAYNVCLSVTALIIVYLVHPMVYILVQFIPVMLLRNIVLICFILVICDFLAVTYAVHSGNKSDNILTENLKKGKSTLGRRISRFILNRLRKAYPRSLEYSEPVEEKSTRFAHGVCADKLVWVFLITSILGVIIETFVVRYNTGRWTSRASLIYGPFSIVWGAGAVVLTVVLHRLKDKPFLHLFLAGFFLGGTFEYLCSVLSEVVFGSVFWDYTNMHFNIGGRINLLFCLFWGILSVIWIKWLYPSISMLVEKIPPIAGTVITWTITLLLVFDILISGIALARYTDRLEGIPASNDIELFIDYHYPDELLENIWPNMRIVSDS